MHTKTDPVADAAGQSEEHASARPDGLKLSRIIAQEGEYGIEQAIGVHFTDSSGEIFRQAIIFRHGEHPEIVAALLEKLATFIRTGEGASWCVGEEVLTGREMNRGGPILTSDPAAKEGQS
jgi:hypothetical protein